MSDIQKKVKCVIGLTVALIIILVVLSIVYLGCDKNSNPVINSLTLIGSYAGAITTLAAAYIASLLFNDWRDEAKYKLIIQNREKLIADTNKLKDLNLEFYNYSNSEEEKNIEITYSKYLDCIWCFNDIKENLFNYITVVEKLNLNKSHPLDLTTIQAVLSKLNKQYEEIKCNKSEMTDPISVSDKMRRSTFQMMSIEEFCKGPAFEYEVNYLTKF